MKAIWQSRVVDIILAIAVCAAAVGIWLFASQVFITIQKLDW